MFMVVDYIRERIVKSCKYDKYGLYVYLMFLCSCCTDLSLDSRSQGSKEAKRSLEIISFTFMINVDGMLYTVETS